MPRTFLERYGKELQFWYNINFACARIDITSSKLFSSFELCGIPAVRDRYHSRRKLLDRLFLITISIRIAPGQITAALAIFTVGVLRQLEVVNYSSEYSDRYYRHLRYIVLVASTKLTYSWNHLIDFLSLIKVAL